MIKRLLFLFLFILMLPTNGVCQCTIKYKPFKPGEVLNFQAFYNWGFIWIHAGEVQFRTFEKLYKGEPAYHFEATGNSLKNYDWLYKVRDKFTSYVDKDNLLPRYYERNTYEGGYKAFEQYFFNYSKKRFMEPSKIMISPLPGIL
ncbi:MAG: DUF3108 domain-containing protein [Bacteroidales bacterium]|nr:DUF3108 domain-containing protein [Bacteroidales bacterium]